MADFRQWVLREGKGRAIEAVDIRIGDTIERTFVRSMTVAERDKVDQFIADASQSNDGKASLAGFRAFLVMLCNCDEEGTRLWSDVDLPTLGELRAEVLEPIVAAIQKRNGFSSDDLKGTMGNSSGDRPA